MAIQHVRKCKKAFDPARIEKAVSDSFEVNLLCCLKQSESFSTFELFKVVGCLFKDHTLVLLSSSLSLTHFLAIMKHAHMT